MEAADKNGTAAENMAFHCIENFRANFIRVCTLSRWLRDIQLRIEGVQLKSVMVIRTRRRARAHVALAAETELACAVGQFTLHHAFGQPGRSCRNVPYKPMENIGPGTAVLHRLRIMHQQNKALRAHWNLRELQFGRDRHRTGFLRVFVRNDAAIFKRRCCHEKWRRLGTSSTAAASLTAARPASITATTLTTCLAAALLSHERSRHRYQCYEKKQNCDNS
jgi:hypothetical protein